MTSEHAGSKARYCGHHALPQTRGIGAQRLGGRIVDSLLFLIACVSVGVLVWRSPRNV